MAVKFSQNARIATTVFGSEIVGGFLITPGVIYCAENFLPHQMDWLKRIFAKYIVEPHEETFEKFASHIIKESDEQEKQDRQERINNGEKVEPEGPKPVTKGDRCYRIADGLVKALLATGVDLLATLGILGILNKKLNAGIKPARTAFTDASVHLGAMAAMPTIFARQSAWMCKRVSNMLQKVFGMEKKNADNFATSSIYVGIPGLAGMGASLAVAHSSATR